MDSRQIINFLATPYYVNYAEKPLRLGGKSEKIPTQKFAKKHGFYWFEGLIYSSTNLVDSAEPFPEKLTSRIKANFDKLTICKIQDRDEDNNNSESKLGVFANRKIPPGEPIATWTGELFDQGYDNDLKYTTAFGDNKEKLYVICGKNQGNIAKYINHLPQKNNPAPNNFLLGDYEFTNGVTADQVQTANLSLKIYSYKNVPRLVLTTTEMITPGTQLGLSFNISQYMSAHADQYLMNKKGEIISKENYQLINYFVLINNVGLYSLQLSYNLNKDELLSHLQENQECILNDLKLTISPEDFTAAFAESDEKHIINIPQPTMTTNRSSMFQKRLNSAFNEIICDFLKKITENDCDWKYNREKKKAFLKHDDVALLENFKQIFEQKDFEVRLGKTAEEKNVLIIDKITLENLTEKFGSKIPRLK